MVTVYFMAVMVGRDYSVRAKFFGLDGKLYIYTHVARVSTLEHAVIWSVGLKFKDIQPWHITTSKEWK